MERADYRDFMQSILYDMDLRQIMMTDIYDTKCYLHTEYLTLSNGRFKLIYDLFDDFKLEDELKFYLQLDMLTYLPFEEAGVEFLNKKLKDGGIDAAEYKYRRILKILSDKDFNADDEAKNNLRYFLNNYYNGTVKVNIIGIATILLRLFHRYLTLMSFDCISGGVVKIHGKIDEAMDKIKADVTENGLKEININDYLPEFDFFKNQLTDDMIEHLELCLERCGFNSSI